MTPSKKFSQARNRRARCKRVLVIINNRLETADLVHEAVHSPQSDFDEGPLEWAVLRFNGMRLYVPASCVVFLPQKPARAKRKLPPSVQADLRFISQSMQMSGFSGKITPELVEHVITLHRRHPALARGEAYVARVLRGCTPNQVSRLLKATNEVQFLQKLAEFANDQSAAWVSLKRAARAKEDDLAAKRVMPPDVRRRKPQ